MDAIAAQPKARRIAGAGIDLAVDEAGPEDGAPVILLHGGGQTRGAWRGAVGEGARRGFHMFNADLRGHGESGWPEDADYSIDAMVADLKKLIEAIGETPFLVGASMGGLVGLTYAGEGGALRGLVLVDVVPRIEPAGVTRIGGFMNSAPHGFASVEEAADAVAAYLPHRPRPKDVSGLRRNLRLGEDGRYYWHWDPRMMTGRDPTNPERLKRAARNLAIPTLLVRGALSDIVSPEGVKEFLGLVPHAEFVDIAGADHMVAGDRNDAFNEAAFTALERWRTEDHA